MLRNLRNEIRPELKVIVNHYILILNGKYLNKVHGNFSLVECISQKVFIEGKRLLNIALVVYC